MMTTLVNNRQEIDKNNLLEPLLNGNGVGVYLRYEPLYDQIRDARKEDDDTLSQGIWKTEIKKADWGLVESLCAETLQNQSKDIQIVGWLCEAWVVLDGLLGAINGFDLLYELLNKFWPIIYPVPDGDDLEHRLRIFEWLSEAAAERMMFVPLTNSQFDATPFTLADWVAAVSLETIAKRSPEGKALLAEAEASGKATLTRYRKSLNLTNIDYLRTTCEQAEAVSQSLEKLRSFLENHCGSQTPNFLRARNCLEDILRICKTSLEKREAQIVEDENKASLIERSSKDGESGAALDFLREEGGEGKNDSLGLPSDDTVVISERSHAYKALKDISGFLKDLDPHSPTPYLVELAATWEGKTLIQILTEIEQGTNEATRILKLIASIANTAGSHVAPAPIQNPVQNLVPSQ
ncbi:MAG: type VI secretion system protein TssA [Alphaproteobacteria bacterium]|nr:type VI secretion system protein TssA [Alphaproteobacteria bacterium]